MWLENLKTLKKARGLSCAQIAVKANMPERTVSRIFSGDTPAPKIDNICDIIFALDGSLDEIFDMFKGTKAVIGDKDMASLEADLMQAKSELSTANTTIEQLQKELAHKIELIDLYKRLLEQK